MDMSYYPTKGYTALSELMRAIVLKAIDDLKSKGEHRESAVAFFDSDDEDDEYVFSFCSICKHFGMDPGKTRAAILAADHISTRRRTA